jgi:formylmethanofuran dehydrogenase subunit E
MGSRCPNRRVEVHYCDKCDAELFEEEQETSEDGRELCDSCREEEENDD